MKNFSDTKPFIYAALIAIAVELLSIIIFLLPAGGNVAFWALMAIFAFVAIMRPFWALSIVFCELALGGKGYLFSYALGDFEISIRIGIFLVMLAAAAPIVYSRRQSLINDKKNFWLLGSIIAVIILGIAGGLA